MSNEEIKNELIKMGFEENYPDSDGYFLSKKLTYMYSLYYNVRKNSISVSVAYIGTITLFEDATIDRIKALIYGLTGEKI